MNKDFDLGDVATEYGLESSKCLGPEFDSAILGYSCDFRIIYDYDKVVSLFSMLYEWDRDVATEYVDYNVTDNYQGPLTPIFMRHFEED